MRTWSAAGRGVLLALFVGRLAGPIGAAEGPDIRALLPEASQWPGWIASEAPRAFEGEDLYELIDGGADLYLEFGFVRVAVGRYAESGEPRETLQVEIYQMADDAAAYGAYSMMQSGKGSSIDLGQAARLFDYYLVMWKGVYVVSVTGAGRETTSREAILRAARSIAAKIARPGQIPALVGRLPEARCLEQRYFRGPLGLANCHAFASGDPFGAREGVYGVYPDLRLIVLRYENADEATAHLNAAGRTLAQAGAYRDLTTDSAGFACSDAAANRISVRRVGEYIEIRITPAPPAGDQSQEAGDQERRSAAGA